MNIKNIFAIKIIFWTILICFMLSSCGQNAEKSKKQSGDSQKTPEQLTGMEDKIDKIIKALGGPVATKEGQEQDSGNNKEQSSGDSKSEESGKKQGESQEQSIGGSKEKESGKKQGESQEQSSGGSKEKESGEKQGESKGQSQGQSTGEKKPDQQKGSDSQDVWSEITPLITELHYQWDDYLPTAVKNGANKQLVESFSSSLNNLTTVSESKNKVNVLVASSNLYGILPYFYSLYKSKETSPELKRVNHHIRNAIISAMNNNWTQADADINLLNTSWAVGKNTIPKEQQELQSKLDYSIFEFEKVVKEKSQQLTELKGKVAMSNIDAIEKAVKSAGSSSK